ncbi:hypothetical protein LV84_00616 [Algoriphagus ratkowskyi]|uniref:Outer membrane protein with beta-barrel domain n=1 Tax=Algoriphagus ratkowskyi TaxID=57028 RepID=A0A2W7RPC3_9BACT|nr:hypothetical protein [Algoriphagus ratkowskyi]PZX60340.1 hypothetical protein LV84_00616 [Algoriphagus ratkowskyi]TXD78157.1 hypothetical protein ESW18_08935 [Algoriphagus ratkowskyi]
MSLLKSKYLLFFLLALGLSQTSSFAQREIYAEDSVPFKDRLYYGGNFGMQFGSTTLIEISPIVGVMITPKFSSGVGITYQYFKTNYYYEGESTSYGGRVFSRYNILPNIFAHAEFESINFDNNIFGTNEFERIWSNALFLGGGYFAPFGRRGGANFTFLYNVLHDNLRSPYGEPYVIRVGFVL